MKTFALLVACLSSLLLFSQDEWSIDNIIKTERLGSPTLSPDGTMIAWTKSRAIKEKDRFTGDIFVTYLNEKEGDDPLVVQMTQSDESDSSPLFSKDNKKLYFLSGRDKGKKLWAFNLRGGEPEKVHEFKNGIRNIEWRNDQELLFVSHDGKSLYEQELEEKKDNVVLVEDEEHWTINKVYSFNVKTKEIKRLTENAYPVRGYTISPDGRWLIISLTMSRHYASDGQPDPTHYLYDLENGTHDQILADVEMPGSYRFTSDSKGFFFTTLQTSDPEWNGAGVQIVHYYDLSSGSHRNVPLDWKWESEGSQLAFGNGILVALPLGTSYDYAYYTPSGNSWKKQMVDFGMEGTVFMMGQSEDHQYLIYQQSTASKLPEYYLSKVTLDNGEFKLGDKRTIANLNKSLKKKSTAKSEVIKWKGYQGEEVDGILYYPKNYQPGRKYPLILSIHGGPSGSDFNAWSDRWSTYPQLLTQKGAFVLKPNYHGSSHHGQAFVESIKKNYYTPEIADVMSGLDYLDERGFIDRDSLGCMGWSNGAIITTMLTVRHPDLFKVACPGAGDVNWTSDFGTCRFGVTFDQSYFGGAPWDDVNGKSYNEAYITLSPLFEIEKIKTPTIIFHGSEDRAVPRDQGWEYYRGLQQAGQTPVKFFWFPGQPHGLQKVTHQQRKMKEEIAWIDQFLFGKKSEENEAFKEESPLAMILKKDKWKMHNGHLGEWVNNTLVPETAVAHKDSIAIGCFEVTNQQFHAFDSQHAFDVDQANSPAIVSFDQAKKYTTWLSEKTNATYRLPTEKESKALHKAARKAATKENSLNHLAGYNLSLKDAEMLASKVKETKQNLYKPVGSFAPVKVGKAEVYDLGANAQEFDDAGKGIGYDVKDYVDPMNPDQMKPKMAGFRVIKSK